MLEFHNEHNDDFSSQYLPQISISVGLRLVESNRKFYNTIYLSIKAIWKQIDLIRDIFFFLPVLDCLC